jgi:zinc protease
MKKYILQTCVVIASLLMTLPALAGIDIQTWQTSKGAKVLFVESKQLPMLDIEVTFDAGSARDGDIWGLASMTSLMLGMTTSKYSEDQINEAFDAVGANIGRSAGRDNASISLRTLTREKIMNKTLPLFAELISDTTFDKAVFEREMKRLKIGLKQRELSPRSIGSDQKWTNLYGDHPYAHNSSGTLETVEQIDLEKIKAFYQKYYVASNATIAMVGSIDQARAKKIAESLTQNLPVGTKPEPIAKPKLQQAREITVEFDSTQTQYSLSQLGIERGHPDYVALYVGNHLFGGSGFGSRLMEEVREKRGLVYSVYSYFAPMKQTGIFTIGLSTKNASALEADKVVKDTLSAFLKDFSQQDFEAIKQNLLGGWPMRIDSNSKIIGYLSMIGFYGMPLDYLEWFPEQVERTTKEDVLKAWQKHLDPEKMLRVMVGKPA